MSDEKVMVADTVRGTSEYEPYYGPSSRCEAGTNTLATASPVIARVFPSRGNGVAKVWRRMTLQVLVTVHTTLSQYPLPLFCL
jgi:hypothetical protein